MEKFVVGIDVSKERYAVSIFDGEHFVDFSSPAHPEEFLKRVHSYLPEGDPEVLFVMEATGIYHLALALSLREQGYTVSVVNPFVVKKYAEMLLKRAKTDSVDARILAQFGYFVSPSPFVPKEEKAYLLEEILKAIEDYTKRRTEILNRLEALRHHPFPNRKVEKVYEEELRKVEETIRVLEREAENLALQYAPEEYRLLLTIPGVGKRLACAFLAMLSPLTRFTRGKEVASFFGLAPQVTQSGKQKERAWMSKRGNAYFRKLLYLCALTASRYNAQCRICYERLVARGKPKKVALIAVANKLLRQAFAILKSGVPYNPNYLEEKRNFCAQRA